MNALDKIEFEHLATADVIDLLWTTKGTFGRRKAPAHPGLLAWTQDAIGLYMSARHTDQRERALAGAPLTTPVNGSWTVRHAWTTPDPRGVTAVEQTAWGRYYANSTDTHRDLWLLSFGSAKPDRPEAEKAAAASVALHGAVTVRDDISEPDWRRGYRRTSPRLPPQVQRVRLVDVGCTDGSVRPLADWSADEVEEEFARHTKSALDRAITATSTQPGASCVNCKALSGCTALPRTPQLLTIAAAGPAQRRSVSVSDLRAYADCPAKFLLTRQLKLKSKQPENAAIRRGRAVDAWLNRRHQTDPASPCRRPITPAELLAHATPEAPLHAEDAEKAAQMLRQHVYVCPLVGLAPTEQVRVQDTVSCYIPELNLVVLATPDLLHTRNGGWVWRETKTSGSGLFEGKPLLAQYPQLALAILMINAGALGGDVSRSRVELELLTADDAVLEELDPSRTRVVDEARSVISDLADPWLKEAAYDPLPGRACQSCEALDWCTPGQQYLTTNAERGHTDAG
ncbi:PD-(D/E)XK nuclease family protein [Catellatospora sp. NPDC049111]|uniref:PD-(D/E)XK nuclease family protein n=1 Tax=Catellatospora sp. NPDC049111 TaxID=3155271 RepID=UPI0033F24193